MIARRCLLAMALTLASASAVRADDHPNGSRGFAPDKVYQAGDIDTVNLFNGNLTVTIPLGGSHPVNAGLSYGLTLVYNSNVWDFQDRDDEITGTTYHEALPQQTQNAGLGWMVTLGKLMAPGNEGNEDDQHWMYQGNDGAEHVFYPTLHVGDSADSGFSYTRDGSYLRMHVVANQRREIEFPDGQVHHFDCYLHPTSNCTSLDFFRIDKISDRFNNAVNIAYSSDILDAHDVWTITDSVVTDPQHPRMRVVFRWETQDQQPYQVVDKVEVAGFNGSVNYQFGYASQTVARACPHNELPSVMGVNVQVMLLTSLTLPDGSSYQIATSDYASPLGPTDPCRSSGALRGLQLPTFGRMEWTYRDYTFPNNSKVHRQWTAGVSTRKMVAPGGQALGTWQYATSLTGTTTDLQLKNTVTDPLSHYTERYFCALPGSYAYSLPFTQNTADPLGGSRFLSTKTFAAGGTLKRTTYVAYEGDQIPTAPQDQQERMNVNRREISSRTVFNDDANGSSNHYATVTRAKFDGMGHYREEATGGDFGAGDVRTTTVDFNPNRLLYHIDPTTNQPAGDHTFVMLPSTSHWVLGTFASRKVDEGDTAVTEYCFDEDTGYLKRRRTLKGSGTTEDATDVLVVYTPELNGTAATGNVKNEQFYGGDDTTSQNLTHNNTTCGMGLPAAPIYQIDHTYQAGVLATSQYANTTFYTLDQTIHPASGLPSSSGDSAGLQTNYDYDELGRLKWVMPQALGASTHDGYTQYLYTPASSATALASVTINRRGTTQGSAVQTQSVILFDGFGRVRKEKQLLPGDVWNLRETIYDNAGNRASVSELQAETTFDSNLKTQFLSYDPFGRPKIIRPADGSQHEVMNNYFGTRVVMRTVLVLTSQTGPEEPVDTTETYDRQGRLWKVTEPSGVTADAGATTTTTYSYEEGNRLTQVRVVAATTSPCDASVNSVTQTRSFTYDNRGFLISESHPEKNGNVTYSKYDPLGHAHKRIDGPEDSNPNDDLPINLTLDFDAAERLTSVKRTLGSVDLKTFVYATANDGTDARKGKLAVATRYNYPYYPALEPRVAVEESYIYSGRQGRVSDKNTLMRFKNGGTEEDREGFAQSYTYNVLGDVATIDYPVCTLMKTCANSAPRTVTISYTKGRITGISDFISSITYHPNGLYNQITHTNGVIDTQESDSHAMPRPASFTAGRGSLVPLWGAGVNLPYAYDGAGNVTRIGGSWFYYDRLSRIKYASLDNGMLGIGGVTSGQWYTYDPFGNLNNIGADSTSFARAVPVEPRTNHQCGTNVAYDDVGNQTQAAAPFGTCDSGNPCYEYDQFNMMRRMRNSGEDWRYMYTADDERFWSYRVAPSGVANVRSVWTLRDLDGKVLREYDLHLANSPSRDYVYRDGQLVASSYPGEGVRHFSLDHLGTPRLVTSAGGYSRGIWTGASSNCKPAPADFDGDGDTDLSLKCGGAWLFYNDDGSYLKGIWTGTSDASTPVPADYDGDGKDDVAVFDGGAWHFWDYNTGAYHGVWTGTAAGCIPAPADYDGDGNADFSLKCGPVWHFYNDNGSYIKGIWTGASDAQLPVPGDYNGDGRAELVVSNGAAWDFFDYYSGAHTGGIWTGVYGTPVAMDYDGDGTANVTVFYNGAWHIYRSDGSYEQGLWIGAGVTPLHGNFGGDATEEPAVYNGGAWLIYAFTGMPIARHQYFPFGEELSSIRQDIEQMKFTGHERDLGNPSSAADDLDYMHARFYKPLVGRFLSVDPVRSSKPALPQTWNRYSYGLSRPLTMVDHTGKEPVTITAAALALAGRAAVGAGIGVGVRLTINAGMKSFSDPNYKLTTGLKGAAVTGAITGGASAEAVGGKLLSNVAGVTAGAVVNGMAEGHSGQQLWTDAKNGMVAGLMSGLVDAAASSAAGDEIPLKDTVIGATVSSLQESISEYLNLLDQIAEPPGTSDDHSCPGPNCSPTTSPDPDEQ